MPSKAEFYRQMAEQVSTQLVGSWKEWTAFLKANCQCSVRAGPAKKASHFMRGFLLLNGIVL